MKSMMLPALAIALMIGACEKGTSEAKTANAEEAATQAGAATAEGDDHAHEHAAEGDDHAHEAAADEPAAADEVEVPAEGKKFDPPVKPEQLPEGVWYCDMGTVHWAGGDQPEDGKCPLCGMKVKKYEGAADPDEGGHDHHEGEHDHAH